MSDILPFCQIKLQYLLEMVRDHELDDNALRVALYLSLETADHNTGESYPSFETIGAAIGKHSKSIKRALNKVEAAGYLDIKRGTNKGNSSRYTPTQAALIRATKLRREQDRRRRERDKVVPFNRTKGGQVSPQSRSNLSSKAGQDRPPTLEKEYKKERHKKRCPSALSWTSPDCAWRPDDGGVFVPKRSFSATQWELFSEKLFGKRLDHVFQEISDGRAKGFWLPDEYPPRQDHWLFLKEALVEHGWTLSSSKSGAVNYGQ